MKKATVQSMDLTPVNGESKSVKTTIELLQKRKAEVQEKIAPYEAEVERCAEVIQTLRGLLGYEGIPEVLMDAVDEAKSSQSTETPDCLARGRGGPYSASLHGVDTGLHVADVIASYVHDMTRARKFTSVGIRDKLLASGQYPEINTVQVARFLKKLYDEGAVEMHEDSQVNHTLWKRARRKKRTTKKKAAKKKMAKKRTRRKKVKVPECGREMSNELLQAIHDLSGSRDGFTRMELYDTVDMDPITFKNAMVHIIQEDFVRMVDDSGGRLKKVYAPNF